jgi:hypothetical protein
MDGAPAVSFSPPLALLDGRDSDPPPGSLLQAITQQARAQLAYAVE